MSAHARRYSRIREWRAGWAARRHIPSHCKTRRETFLDTFRVEFAKVWPPRSA